MPFPITRGLGSDGSGSQSALLVTGGYSDPGPSMNPCLAFSLISLSVYFDHLALLFSTNILLDAYALTPSNWPISTLSAFPMNVTSVSVSGPTVTLGITQGQGGTLYTLGIPLTGITDVSLNPYPGPYVQNFFAVSETFDIQLAQAVDGITVRCIFNVPVLLTDALIVANYVITGVPLGLTVYAVVQETANSFLLTTSPQVPGQTYDLTVSNVHDLHGNLI